jgi:predicted permease
MNLATTWKQAARRLLRDRSFTLVAVATLGAGIGLTTAIFSVVNGVLLTPLQFPDSQRILSLNTLWKDTGRQGARLSGGDLADLRNSTSSFAAISRAYGGQFGVQMKDHADFTGGFFVDPEFFQVFGTTPAFGRPPHQFEAAVSYSFAQRNFSDPRAALGQVLHVETRAYEIVAVMPPGFRYPRIADVWLGLPPKIENLNRTAYNYPTVAKLKPEVSLETATADLSALGARLAASFPENKNKSFVPVPLREQLAGPVRTMLLVLMGAVGLVLLIACANVANLLLARATGRVREMAVRAALGASRARIIRQLLTESVLLGLISGLVGWGLALAGTGAILSLVPDNLPRLSEVTVDRTALLFATLVSVLSSVLFSLAPAWHASRVDLNEALKQGGGRGIGGRNSNRLRGALVVAEIALAFVLALGAGLLIKSFNGLLSAELGYRTEGILVMYAHLPAGTEAEAKAATTQFERLIQDLATLPGVKSTSAAMGMPAGRYGSNGSYAVEGRHVFGQPGVKLPEAGFRLASPNYFATLGIPLLRGRDFSPRDQYDAEPVAIISQALANQTFPGQDPLGQRIKCGLDRDVWMRVVGVVGDIRADSPASKPGPELYMAFHQHPFFANELQVAIRTDGDPGLLTEPVRRAVQQAHPSIATQFTTMNAMVSESIAAPRFRTFLVGLFAGLALLLAMAGIHGVMAYAVAQRTPELGLRMALGAQANDVARLVLGRALALALAGLLIGAALSLASARAIGSLLVGVKTADAASYALAVLAVFASVLLATALPVYRATRIDPVVALRDE